MGVELLHLALPHAAALCKDLSRRHCCRCPWYQQQRPIRQPGERQVSAGVVHAGPRLPTAQLVASDGLLEK